MASVAHPSRPLRRGFGFAAVVVAAATLAAVAASSGPNPTTSAAAAARLPMTAYGLLLLAVGLWCVVASFAGRTQLQATA